MHVMHVYFNYLCLFFSIYGPECEATHGYHCVIVLPLYKCYFFDCLSYATVLFMSKLRQTSDGPS